MINNINSTYAMTFGTRLMDADTLKFIPHPHVQDAMRKRRITKEQVIASVRNGDAYWNNKSGKYIIYDHHNPPRISAEDIAVIVDRTKRWIITVMDVDPAHWFQDPQNPKNLIHTSRRNNPTVLKNVEPEVS